MILFLQYVIFEVQCPIYLSGWIAAKSVRLFVAHPERYHYLVILGEMPPEELSLATRSANPIDEGDMIGSAIAVDEVIDQGEKIDDERSETEEGGTDGVYRLLLLRGKMKKIQVQQLMTCNN